MARCGRTNLAGGGGVGSDETTATKDKVLKDYTYLGADTDDEIGTGTIESMKGTTVTPSASQQTVSTSGKYLTGNVIVSAVANLTAANIANGKVVGGTTGTYKGLGNATAAQVLAGKTFSTASLSNTAGTMINYSGYTSTSNYTSGTFKSGTTGYIFVVPGGTGYYSNATYLRIPATNLAAGNIKKGVSILGITGTYQGYVDSPLYIFNSGTWGGGSGGYQIISGEVTTYTKESKTTISNRGSKATAKIRTTNALNVSNYKYLHCLFIADYRAVTFGICDANATTIAARADRTDKHNESTFMITSLDISSFTGSYYIYINFGYTTYNGESCYGFVNQLYLTTT